ncbi:MAG: AraC family transcriptional regulator [Bacteroidota bacterium]
MNRLLAFLCFSLTLISLNTYLSITVVFAQNSLLQDLANNVMWFIGPVLYLYVVYNEKKPENLLIYLNTFPFIILAVIDIGTDWKWFREVIPFVAFTQMGTYIFLSIKHSRNNYSKAKQYYNWILPSTIVFAVLVAINFSLFTLKTTGIQILSDIELQSFTSLLVIPIFYLAYKEMNSANAFGIPPRKYEASQISEQRAREYLLKIESAMEEDKVYLQKNLSLQTFSEYVGISSKFVSQVINQNLNVGFSEYVLRFRLNDVKKRLCDSKNKNLTIFGIAQESGFKSNSRFNYLFKKHLGLTPRQFQKMNRE